MLAIIIWHMYGVHVKRFNKSMFTGQMSEHDMLHEHPLELADIKAGIAERQVDPVTLRKRERAYFPVEIGFHIMNPVMTMTRVPHTNAQYSIFSSKV